MPDSDSVAATLKSVAAAYKSVLKRLYNNQLSAMGSKIKRAKLPVISPETGSWADSGVRSKPNAWLVEFRFDSDGKWNAGPPAVPHNKHWKRLGGSFNSGSPLQGVLARLIPVIQVPADPAEDVKFVDHPYWEWGLAFVFPSSPTFMSSGSSGATIDFDPITGKLSSTIDGKEFVEPYVAAGLFKLVPDNDPWSLGELHLTYGEATAALEEFINVDIAAPAESKRNDVAASSDSVAASA